VHVKGERSPPAQAKGITYTRHAKELSSNRAVANGRKPMPSRPEMRVNSGVNREKSLRLPEGLEPAHAPLAFPCGLVGVFSSIVQPVSAFVSGSGQDTPQCGTIAAEPIGDYGVRDGIRRLDRMTEEAFRCRPIPPLLHQNVHDLTVLIDCSPQVDSADSKEDLVDMPAFAHPRSVPAQSAGILGAELPTPQANRLIADPHAAGGQHLLDVPE
jgi:hypothetical protein